MNEMQVFTYQESQVRTVQKDGEPWFVLKDVCSVLGISNSRMASDRLEADEVSQTDIIDALGRNQTATIISESGLYTVILRSDKPEAKPFRKWVTSEVLPSIRKTGGYIQGQDQLSPEELMAKALMVAQKTLADREARISQLTVENQIMAPKAEYFNWPLWVSLVWPLTAPFLFVKYAVAKLLEKKFLYRGKNGKLLPMESRNDGYFQVKECLNEKTQWSGTQTLVTPKGREAFRLLMI